MGHVSARGVRGRAHQPVVKDPSPEVRVRTYTAAMAMGKRTSEQAPMWISTTDLPVSPGHPFYARLNAILDEAGFDRFAEEQCWQFYAPVMGRPGLPSGRYFRLLLLGYFEGLDAERGIAWRAADSLAVRSFVGLRSSRPFSYATSSGGAPAAPVIPCSTSLCIRDSKPGRVWQRGGNSDAAGPPSAVVSVLYRTAPRYNAVQGRSRRASCDL